jgi:hypothetical protein
MLNVRIQSCENSSELDHIIFVPRTFGVQSLDQSTRDSDSQEQYRVTPKLRIMSCVCLVGRRAYNCNIAVELTKVMKVSLRCACMVFFLR